MDNLIKLEMLKRKTYKVKIDHFLDILIHRITDFDFGKNDRECPHFYELKSQSPTCEDCRVCWYEAIQDLDIYETHVK